MDILWPSVHRSMLKTTLYNIWRMLLVTKINKVTFYCIEYWITNICRPLSDNLSYCVITKWISCNYNGIFSHFFHNKFLLIYLLCSSNNRLYNIYSVSVQTKLLDFFLSLNKDKVKNSVISVSFFCRNLKKFLNHMRAHLVLKSIINNFTTYHWQ